MLKFPLISALFFIAILLASCAGDGSSIASQEGQILSQANESEPTILDESTPRELPDSIQLILGTYKLEQSDLKVDQGQAAELLPLWKAYRALLNSDSAAQEELDAVIHQIQETMTPAQMEVIENSEANPEEMFALVQELGIVPENFQSDEGAAGGGGFPGGAGPGGGLAGGAGLGGGQRSGPALGGDLSPEQRETLQAERGGTLGLGNRFGAMLIDPLIDLLEERAAG
jgi:hypothetical protein